MEEYYPILGKGELLSGDVELSSGGFSKDDIRSFDAAREKIIPELEGLSEAAKSIPTTHRLNKGVFFCVDMDSSYVAKSYYPKTIVSSFNWELVGSIAWKQHHRDGIKIKEKQSRRLFFRGTPNSVLDLGINLSENNSLSRNIQKEIIRFDSVRLLDADSKVERIRDIPDGSLVELIIHSMLESEWNECLKKLRNILKFKNYPDFLFDWVRGGAVKSPRFLPAIVDKKMLHNLAMFNPLRSVRVMPGISFPRIDAKFSIDLGSIPKGHSMRLGATPEIGVFDGGVDTSIPHLGLWVVPEDLTTLPAEDDSLIHGTAVCGAVLYGNYDPSKAYAPPPIMVKSFRIFPVPKDNGFNLELYRVLNWIENTVEKNPQIKTYVLSFGPDFPIEDDEIDPFTVTLDRLAYEKDILFIVAAGNKGMLASPYNRIQPPSDIINGIGVGAFMQNVNGDFVPASYSCTGPGRCGNAIKPDVHAFGGDAGQLFNVFLAKSGGKCTGVCGTSFAAPVISSIAGHLLHRVDDHSIITPQTAKALLIHNAIRCDDWDANFGWGVVNKSPDEIMACMSNGVTVIYNGEIDFKRCVRLQIPFFADAVDKGMVTFRWTFVFATGIAPGMPDEYSLAGTDISFRPHSDVYTFTIKKGSKTVTKVADIKKEPAKAMSYVVLGMKRSLHPKTRAPKRNEQQRREEGVWDTVEHCWTKMNVQGVQEPCLDVHALSRSDWEYGPESPGKIRYAAIVSIEFSRKNALYQLIRDRIPALVPVRLRSEARIRV